MTVTATQIAHALAGTSQARAVSLRFEHRTRGGLLLGDITHAFLPHTYRDECDNSRAVTMTGQVTARADLLPDPLQQVGAVAEVKVRPHGQAEPETVDVPLNLWRPAFAERRSNSDGKPLVDIRLQSQESHLLSETLDEPYDVAAGTAYLAAIGTILTAQGLRHDIATGGPVNPLAHTFAPGVTWYAVLKWLADGLNYFAPYPDGRGIFRTRERINPANEASAVHYRDTEPPLMVDGGVDYREPLDDVQRKNRCVVVIDDPRHADFGYVAWENADPTSPVSTANIDTDILVLNFDSPTSTRCLLDEATAVAVASYELREEASRYRTPELGTLVDPRRGAREYVTLTLSGRETAQKYRVAGWSRDFGAGRMTHRLARVAPVALTEVEG